MNNQRGSSLVEVLASGSIGAMVASMLLSVFSAQTTNVDGGVTHGRLMQHAQAINNEIGASVHKSNRVLAPAETWSSSFTGDSAISTQQMNMYDTSGTLIEAYRLQDQVLERSVDGIHWTPFVVGFYGVNAAPGSSFRLSTDRQTVSFDLSLTAQNKNRTYTLAVQGDMNRCRN